MDIPLYIIILLLISLLAFLYDTHRKLLMKYKELQENDRASTKLIAGLVENDERQTDVIGDLRAEISALKEEKNAGHWLPFYSELLERIQAHKRLLLAQQEVVNRLIEGLQQNQGRKKK